jgi:2-polyprenyl-3-methyl-5-hydroxy-6-metoxy-1,4-benzoquinol methylase
VRPGLVRRRELAEEVVREYGSPRVLDVGCGSGRVAEYLLEAGASTLTGIDLSPEMLELARARLARFGESVELVLGDFMTLALTGPYDVIVAVGLFDYVPEPEAYIRRAGELCAGSMVASFPRWHWLKGPIRRLRYEVLSDCPIFDYTEPELRRLFSQAGFRRVSLRSPAKSGFLVRADR